MAHSLTDLQYPAIPSRFELGRLTIDSRAQRRPTAQHPTAAKATRARTVTEVENAWGRPLRRDVRPRAEEQPVHWATSGSSRAFVPTVLRTYLVARRTNAPNTRTAR